MSTVLKTPSLKFKINENDHNPPHVHVEGLGASVRISLDTFEVLDPSTAFSRATVKNIIKMVKQNRQKLRKVWNHVHPKR